MQTLEAELGVPVEELTRVEAYAGDSDPLRSTRTAPDPHPRWNSPNSGATDATGFGALPSGFRVGEPLGPWSAAQFARLGAEANLWTTTAGTTPTGGDGHWARGIGASPSQIYRGVVSGWGFGVRCREE